MQPFLFLQTANRDCQGSLYIAYKEHGDAILPRFVDKYVLVFIAASAPADEPNLVTTIFGPTWSLLFLELLD